MREHNLHEDVVNEIASEVMHVYRRLLQRGAQRVESMNIGVGQVPILKLLSDNGTMTQRRIADEMRVTPATICGTLKRMERAGWIRREAAETDGRVSCVSLTEEGRICCQRAFSAIGLAHAEMLEGFSEKECLQLKGFIGRMGRNLLNALEKNEEGFDE